MEVKVSSNEGGLSPPDSVTDPEKEVSDEDDDDRNHKHRRKETRSQSSERDNVEPLFTRSYRKRYKPFENGHSFRQNDSHSNDTWKNFEKRRPGPGRGRGRDSGSWSQRDRFSSVDMASQMVQHGSITPGLFPGRGLPNAQNASWNAFGLMPAIPNGGLDTLHSIGLQGALGPAVNNPLNMGIPRQRCRDFEEQGFCLRGDMCPMEHGVNRIVVEDVQSLSQFNLPVSLPTAPILGPTTGPGALPSVGAHSKSRSRSSKPDAMVDNGMFNGAFSGSATMGGADFYDPDQPLWNYNGPGTSTSLLALHSSKDDETEPFMNADASEHHNGRLDDGVDNESKTFTSQTANSSVWGRVGVKNKLEKTDNYLDNKIREDQVALVHIQGSSHQGKRIVSEDTIPNTMDSSAKPKIDASRFMGKPSQKAQCTLFVCGVPQKSNRKDALLSHFQKFGTVVDIYIPSNSEKAFVQFSKREEAEAALRAPDAVMGNRFIKLWWANRDTIPGDGIHNRSIASSTLRGVPPASVPPTLSTVNTVKGNIPGSGSGGTAAPASEASLTSNGLKAPLPLQKKLELEQLKEELRKKQELLAQKRDDFRRQLSKLEKHATVVKGEVLSEPAAKRPKVSTASDAAKVATPRSSNPATPQQSQQSQTLVDKNTSAENASLSSPKTMTLPGQQESMGLKQQIRPLAAAGTPFSMNRYKLDNRPTSFRILPPLPSGLANVDALKEHFSSYGDISAVELEEIEPTDDSRGQEVSINCSARLAFATRYSAEKAFSNGKCWQGNTLQFMWVKCSTPGTENIPSASKITENADVQPPEKSRQSNSPEAHVSGNKKPETPERNHNVEHNAVPEPCLNLSTDEKKSPKAEGSATSMSRNEEALETEPETAVVSEEK